MGDFQEEMEKVEFRNEILQKNKSLNLQFLSNYIKEEKVTHLKSRDLQLKVGDREICDSQRKEDDWFYYDQGGSS